MKFKTLLFLSILVIASCEVENNIDELTLIDGIWILDGTSNSIESIDFKEDKTYKITTTTNDINTDYGFPPQIGFVTGEWELENNVITFLTSNFDFVDYSDLEVSDSTINIISFDENYGVLFEHSGENIVIIPTGSPIILSEDLYLVAEDRVIPTTDSTIMLYGNSEYYAVETFEYDYSPNVWILQELTEEILVVESDDRILKYLKQ